MDWTNVIKNTIDYIEDNLLTINSVSDIAENVYVSQMYLQTGFQVMTGYSIGEYIRNRKLYLAGKEIINGPDHIIDIALKYGYDTPESFTKAFKRFHNVTPSELKKHPNKLVEFNRLTISIVVKGENKMDFKVTKMFPIKVIGFEKVFNYETSQKEIPLYWDEICDKYCKGIYNGEAPKNDYEQAIVDNCIGEYAVCVDDIGPNKFRYIIGGRYTGGKVPEGMTIYEFPSQEWVIFNCIGPLPDALQSVNNYIFKEWLPNNEEYELALPATIEWYDCINGAQTDPDYHSQIWLPIKKKNNK